MFSLVGVYDFTNSHWVDFRLIADFDIWIGFQIVILLWMLWRAALRCHENIVVSIDHSHEWGLADYPCFSPSIGHNDDGQVCIPPIKTSGTSATFI